jgi:PAS domain S-box-containing protein
MIPPSNTFSSSGDTFAFLTGDGEMSRLIRAFDWSCTSLGAVSNWPLSLRNTLSILLNAKLPMGLWWGEDFIQFYNDAYRPCLGQEGKHPQALGQRGPECWPEAWPMLEPLIQGVLAGGEATWQENIPISIYRNGRTEDAYWTFSYSPVRDERGKVAGVLVLCQETTRQIESQRISGQRFENFVRQASVGIIVLKGEEMVVEVVNDAYGRLIDRSIEALLNQPLFAVIPEAKADFYPILEKVRLTGEALYLYDHPYFVLVEGVRKEGFLDLVYQPYRESDGSISGVMVLCHEVTEKIVARRKVEDSEEKYRGLFEKMDQAFCIVEMIFDSDNRPVDYRFLETNPVFEKQTGLVNVNGKTARELVPNLEAHWFEIYGRVALTGESTQLVEGSPSMARWFEVNAFRLGDQPSRKVAVLFSDITQRKQAEMALAKSEKGAQALAEELAASNEELAAANEELQAANEEIRSTNEELGTANLYLKRTNTDLDNFIYTASHDLKSPITNIEGLMQNLWRTLPAESLATERVGRVRTLMQDSVERFKKTIDSLTEVVKLQKENSTEAVLVDLAAVIREVKLDLEPIIVSSGTLLEIDLSNCSAIRFPEKNLRSVIYNLLSNAIKYRSPHRTPLVSIHCERITSGYLLTVRDNGLGMEPGGLSQLFTMFKRFHDHVEGSGIGLYMIKKMVENAGGSIQVESRLGVGSTFQVYFPG